MSTLQNQILKWLAVSMVLAAGSAAGAPQPNLYVVSYAHLDTQWRWEYPQTIGEFLPNTLSQNFALLDKYPSYRFNFTGSNRYEFIKEYFPADYARLKEYVAAGRWFPGGSNVEEGDLDCPSPESLWRQILYANQFFRGEFGRAGEDFMDPDAFGFPASLPSILAHAGLKGFSTQKLGWGSAVGTPFNLGTWVGPDGRGIVAALNPGAYSMGVAADLSQNPLLLERVQKDGEKSGVYSGYRYQGIGDTGGSPSENSVQNLEKSVQGQGPLQIVSATSDQLFRDLTPAQIVGLPRYQGDLLLTEHSAGSLTSQAVIKQWNNRNEVLAAAAESTAVASAWLGAQAYPRERLNRAWRLVLGAQFHDIMAGTATPKAFEYAWNDQLLALNQFAGVLSGAVRDVAAALDTRAQGTALVVFNSLSIAREDVVEAQLSFPKGIPSAVQVIAADGSVAPSQLRKNADGTATLIFLARVPALGFTTYDVRPAQRQASRSALKASASLLENERYRVQIDAQGDIAQIRDKQLQRDLLTAPARLAFQTENPRAFPAWNMDWKDQNQPPRGFVKGPAKIRVIERGPARVAVEITRESESSRFVQTIRLAAGDAGQRIEIANAIDWKTQQAALKASFSLSASNPLATYNLGLGTIERGNNDPRKYEVPAHQWFDLTDRGGEFGVTVLSGGKIGSDKPDDNTLRLTLIYTPGVRSEFKDQGTQDFGHHEFVYGLAGHAGDWRREQSDWQAERLNSPLLAFRSASHPGALGKTFSLAQLSSSRVKLLALKQAEQSDELIVRLAEADGRAQSGVRMKFAAPLVSAREVDAQERPIGQALIENGALEFDLTAYQPRSFAVKLAPPPARGFAPHSTPVPLPFERAVASRDGTRSARGFDDQGAALPAEQLPAEITYQGIRFALGPVDGANALVPRGQKISLPACRCQRLYILAAAAGGDQTAAFRLGSHTTSLSIQNWTGYVGQWDYRLWRTADAKSSLPPAPSPGGGPPPRNAFIGGPRTDDGFRSDFGGFPNPEIGEYAGLQPGFIKRSPVAWFASHHHDAEGRNQIYAYSYLFAYTIELPPGERVLTLPDNGRIRILAMTLAEEPPAVQSMQAFYDMAQRPRERP